MYWPKGRRELYLIVPFLILFGISSIVVHPLLIVDNSVDAVQVTRLSQES